VTSAAPGKKRPRLLLLGWILLAASLLLCLVGPRLSVSDVPIDIKNRMGDADWIGFAWIIAGSAVGALALVCFALVWILGPGRSRAAHQRKDARSKQAQDSQP
jgi:hypothetical protein